jgi:Immunoglobulin I-set domain
MSKKQNKLRVNTAWIQSSGCSITSIIINLVACAAILAGFGHFGGSAKAANVLVNPGAETGNITGWTLDPDGSIASATDYYYNGGTNYPPYASNILTHTGGYCFKTYQTYANANTRIYQDIAAGPGSQWTANCYALSHAQDYISTPCNAHLQVVFYDVNYNALAVYGSVFLDPTDLSGLGVTWTVVPPMALDATGWLYLQVTNSYSADPATEGNYNNVITPPLVAPAGTAYVRYQMEFYDGAGGGGSVFWDDCDLEKISGSDPDITTAPAAQIVSAGSNATFTVVGTGNTALSYQWQAGTNNVSGARFIGANTATLTISNCATADANTYSVVITDVNGTIQSVPVTLTVLTTAAAANALGPNAGFESGVWTPPWHPFNGTGIQTTNNVYYNTTIPVNVYDGKYVVHVYDGGTDNGFYYTSGAITNGVVPGSVWKAAGHAYITSTYDNLSASNTCRIQVHFDDANTNQIGPTYESFKIYGAGYTSYPQMARDTWVYLPVTNVVDNTDTPTNTVQDFVAPAGAASIAYQVYYYSPPGGGGTGGSVYWDDMELYQLISVTVTPSVSGGTYKISFATRGGSTYSVLYKNHLTDPTWSVLQGNIAGTGTTVTVTDTTTGSARFYQVQTQ